MHNIGLKLWSTNTDYYLEEAKRLYAQGLFDYIELYVVPDTLENICKWKSTKIPFALHAPHFMHGVNLADKTKLSYNKEIFTQVEEYRQSLSPTYTVIHSGMNGAIEETISQINDIKPISCLVENKPYYAPLKPDLLCRGATDEEILQILEKTDCGFCLDIGHAICTANSLGLEPYSYVKDFQRLKPKAYHLSGNFIDSDKDQHLHLCEGNYDYTKIFQIIDTNKPIAIETRKSSKVNLLDFEDDVNHLTNITNS